MNPQIRRIVVPVILLVLAAGTVALVAITRSGQPAEQAAPQATEQPAEETPADEKAVEPDAQSPDDAETNEDTASRSDEPPTESTDEQPTDAADDAAGDQGAGADGELHPGPTVDLTGLHAVAPTPVAEDAAPPQPLGSLNPNEADLHIEFSRSGAGIERITSAKYWYTAAAKLKAEAYYDALKRGVPAADAPPLPDEDRRYVLTEAGQLNDYTVPAFAANSLQINGNSVGVFGSPSGEDSVWSETAQGQFETEIRNAAGEAILQITRTYELGEHGDIPLRQRLVNLTGQALEIKWIQYGPSELAKDRWSYIDMRRYRIGYQKYPEQHPEIIVGKDNSQIFAVRSLLGDAAKAAERGRELTPQQRRELLRIWPNDDSIEGGFALSWFASTNRYFAVAVHPLLSPDGSGDLALTRVVDEIWHQAQTPDNGDAGVVFTVLYSPAHTIEPDGTLNLDMGVYAGPMDEDPLDTTPTFTALKLKSLILYQMSSFCAICTFQWLAHTLLFILGAVHFVLQDWAIAIIILVVIVRTLLHPITKKSQINMQRFTRGMSALKPEIDKLQKKYKDEPKKLQQEQLKLWREHNISPFQMLGCLPMFLQTPIWIALYASLYFAFDLRQQPAFYGIFQLFGHWQFLADLAAPDRFITLYDEPKKFTLIFLHFDISSINILPLLMGAIFFVQQKYMSPPASPNMTDQQQQQQKMMRILMVVMMPVFLYSAPSGLILYILTSSTLGVLESRYIRAHIDQLDLDPRKGQTKGRKKKPRDAQARAYADALERAKAKRQQKQTRRYKKRK